MSNFQRLITGAAYLHEIQSLINASQKLYLGNPSRDHQKNSEKALLVRRYSSSGVLA
jgi:hypothetical protein